MICATCSLEIAADEPRITLADGATYHAPYDRSEYDDDGKAVGEPTRMRETCPPAVEPGEPAPPPAPTERWISLDSYQRRLEEAVPGILARIQLEAADVPTEPQPVRLMRAQLRADVVRFTTLDATKGINLADPDTRAALVRMSPFGMTAELIDTVVLR